MEVEVVLPKWGLTMSEATIVEWLRDTGERVEEGDPLVEVETEKANAEVPAPAAGVVAKLLIAEGTTVEVGTPIAILSSSGESAEFRTPDVDASATPRPLEASGGPSAETPARPAGDAHAKVESPESGTVSQEPKRTSPVARRIAREFGVDLSGIEGTGPRGLITEKDVRAAIDAAGGASIAAIDAAGEAPAASPTGLPDLAASRVETMTGMRKAIAASLTRSLRESAQLTLSRTVAMDEALAVKAESSEGTTLTDVILAAVARSLPSHQRLNAHVIGDEIHLYDDVNLGLAVALDEGLVTPVIRNANVLPLEAISAERRRLVALAHAGELKVTDLAGGTFTVTNLGGYGIDVFTPILNPPEVGILGVGVVRPTPAVVEGELAVRNECVLSLTFDHRALDGAPAAAFLAEVSEILEDRGKLDEVLE